MGGPLLPLSAPLVSRMLYTSRVQGPAALRRVCAALSNYPPPRALFWRAVLARGLRVLSMLPSLEARPSSPDTRHCADRVTELRDSCLCPPSRRAVVAS